MNEAGLLSFDGGQGGSNTALNNQPVTSSNLQKSAIEITGEFGTVPNQQNEIFAALQPRVREAAMWLHLHGAMITGSAIIAARRRFALTVMEAAEAAKIAHALAKPRA